MADILHRIGIKAKPGEVYQRLATVAGVAGWWTKETTGSAVVGGTLTFTFRSADGAVIGEMKGKVTQLTPDKKMVWRITAGPEEWIGTDITFDLAEADGQTIVIFGHRNWKKPAEFMAHCSMKWATFLLSLKDLVEKGKGKPAPDDLKIDNWN